MIAIIFCDRDLLLTIFFLLIYIFKGWKSTMANLRYYSHNWYTEPNNFPSCMVFEEVVGSDSQEICNNFAKFFQGNYIAFNDSFDREYFDYLPEHTSNISATSITVQEILTALEVLDSSKGPGPDGIPPFLLKKLATSFVKPLFWLFNNSLASGVFPSQWKKSFLLDMVNLYWNRNLN